MNDRINRKLKDYESSKITTWPHQLTLYPRTADKAVWRKENKDPKTFIFIPSVENQVTEIYSKIVGVEKEGLKYWTPDCHWDIKKGGGESYKGEFWGKHPPKSGCSSGLSLPTVQVSNAPIYRKVQSHSSVFIQKSVASLFACKNACVNVCVH